MKKNSTKGYLILGILFLLVSIIAFVIPTVKNTAFWIAYAFTTIAFAAQIGIWKVAFGREDTLKSKFLGFPVVHVGIVYLIVQTITFAVFMFTPTLPTWSAVVACSCVAGISAICMIASDIGRTEIERIEVKVQQKVFYIKSLQVDLEMLADTEPDADIKKALRQLAEKIRFSDPMSSGQLSTLEGNIVSKVNELKTASNKMALISELNTLLVERNKKCKLLK